MRLRKIKRKKRVRSKVFGTNLRPRLNVFRSNRYLFAQIIDDQKGKTLVSLHQKSLKKQKGKKSEIAFELGENLAKKAKLKKISKVVFDKSSYKYHGRIKAFAKGARKGGLNF